MSMSFQIGVHMNVSSSGHLFFNMPEQRETDKAQAEVSALCQAVLNKKYGENPVVRQRLDRELRFMEKTNSAFFYRILMEIAELAKAEGVPLFCSPAGSIIDYLIGASPLNPLKPHYYCPGCRHFEIAPGAKDGYDLPQKGCPICGNEMIRDGHNCSEWMSWSSFDQPLERDHFGVKVAEPVFRKLQAYLDGRLSQTRSHKGLFQRIEVMDYEPLDTAVNLLTHAGLTLSSVPLDDGSVREKTAAALCRRSIEARGCDTGLLDDYKDISFNELLRLYGMTCGSFAELPEIGEIHTDRFLLKDEIFDLMGPYGIPLPLAAQLAHRIAWGHAEVLPLDLKLLYIPGNNLWSKADCFHRVLTEYLIQWLTEYRHERKNQ